MRIGYSFVVPYPVRYYSPFNSLKSKLSKAQKQSKQYLRIQAVQKKKTLTTFLHYKDQLVKAVEIIAVYSENDTNPINIKWRYRLLTQVGHIVTIGL
jgi:hypothetical protein